MNEFSTLQTLRSDVQTPSDEQLAPAFAKLSAEMSRKPWHRPVMRTSWFIAAAGAATAVALIAGNLNTATVAPAEASVVLMQAADNINIGSDPVVGPNQYQLVTYTVFTPDGTIGDDGKFKDLTEIYEIFKPGDPSKPWIETVTEPNLFDSSKTDHFVLSAPNGSSLYFKGVMSTVNYAEMPLTNGADAIAFVRAQLKASQWYPHDDVQILIEILGYLGTGFATAAEREVLFDALATMDNVTSTANVKNADGQVGVSIGHTYTQENENGKVVEKKGSEIIIDPSNGTVIGSRTVDLFSSDEGEVLDTTTITSKVVDKAPEPNISSPEEMLAY